MGNTEKHAELQRAVVDHAIAIREAIKLHEGGNDIGAWSKIEGASTSLDAAIRSQCAGFAHGFTCPQCSTASLIIDWLAADKRCPKCGFEADPVPE